MQQSFCNSSEKAAHEAHLTFELSQILLFQFHLGRGFYGHVMLEKGAYLRFIPFSLGLLVYCQFLSSPHCLVWSEQWFGVKQGTSNQSTSSKHKCWKESDWRQWKSKILYSCSSRIYSHYTNAHPWNKSWRLLLFVNLNTKQNSPSRAVLLWLSSGFTYTRQVAKHSANLKNVYIFF